MKDTASPSRTIHSRAWTLAGFALGFLPIVAGVLGPREWLSYTCADLMYARGWTCFVIWFTLAVVAAPFRVHGAGAWRSLAHGFLGSFTWSWWTLAVVFANLCMRAELLHLAYCLGGFGLANWRTWLHALVLGTTVRSAMRRAHYCPGAIRLAGGCPHHESVNATSFPDRLLDGLARLRQRPIARLAHHWLFGPTGESRIILGAAMDATNVRFIALHGTLAAEKRGDKPDPGIEGAASELSLAFRQEVEIWVALRTSCDESSMGAAIQARALTVFGLLAICIARGRMERCPDFQLSLEILVGHESLSSETADAVESAGRITPAQVGGFLRAGRPSKSIGVYQRMLVHLATASGLARLRVFRPARAILAAAREECDSDAERDRRPDREPTRAVRTLLALLAEIERASIERAAEGESARPTSASDEGVLQQRRGREETFRVQGLHPDSDCGFKPSDFASLPEPRRPREIGSSLGAAVPVAAFVLVALCSVLMVGRSWTDRLKIVDQVPFRDSVVGSGVRDADVALTGGTPTILMADAAAGVGTLDLHSLRPDREGGPGTSLDGTVRSLVSNPDGSALALFEDAASGDACVSARGRDGSWTAVIAPAALDLEGGQIEAFLSGLSEPLLLRRDGPERLLRYDERARTVRIAETIDDVAIEGRMVACGELPPDGDRRGLILVTDRADSGPGTVHLVTESGAGEPLEIRTVPSPPLERRTIVAVAADSRGRMICVDSGGGAWQRSWESSDEPWIRLRPGDQGLQIDSIDLAIVDDEESRLWMVRKGEIWTRSLESGPEGPSDGRGWTREVLPAATFAGMRRRPLAFPIPGSTSGVYLLVPARPEGIETGSVLRITCEPIPTSPKDGDPVESIAMREELKTGTRLVDADVLGTAALLTLRERVDAVDLTTFEILTEKRRSIRSSPAPASTPWDAAIPLTLVAVDRTSREAIGLFRDGQFIRFDPTRDRLRPADPAGEGLVGAVTFPPHAVDFAFDAESAEALVHVLRRDGSVSTQPIRSGSEPGPASIDTSSSPPNSILKDARFVLADREGAVILTKDHAWRFSTLAGPSHFSDRTDSLGRDPRGMLATRFADGTPGVAWLSDGGTRFHRLSGGVFGDRALDIPLAGLQGRFEGGVFGSAADGSLWTLDIDSDPRSIWPSHGSGPSRILGSAIRRDFVDFLGPTGVHSIRRSTAAWSVSPRLEGSYSIHSIGSAADPATLLLPKDLGLPHAILSGADAGSLRSLTALGRLDSSMVLADGVLGRMEKDGRLGWISADGSRHHAIGPGGEQGLSLAEVHEAWTGGNALFLRGNRENGQPTLVRYPLGSDREGDPVRTFTAPGLRAMRITTDGVYVLCDEGVKVLQPQSLALERQFPIDAQRSAVLAESAGNRNRVAIATPGGIDRLVGTTRVSALVAPTPEPAGSARMAAAWSDQLVVFDGRKAWKRSARATDPFAKVSSFFGEPDALAFGPDGSTVWGRVEREWVNVERGTRAGRSLGWTADGRSLTCDAGGRLLLDGTALAGFDRGERSIGVPVGIEPFGSDRALLIGRSGSMVIDVDSRTFPPTPEVLAGIKDGCRILPARESSSFAWKASGEVISLDRNAPAALFGGSAVEEILLEPRPFAALRDGRIVDGEGRTLAGMPPRQAGAPIKVTTAVATEVEIIRLRDDRTIDRIDRDTLVRTADDRRADGLARIGPHVLGLDRAKSVVQWLTGPAGQEMAATDWFIGSDAIAMVDPHGRVRVLDGTATDLASPRREALPGEIAGNLAGTPTALMHLSDGTSRLFDLVEGRSIQNSLPGVDHVVAGDRVLARSASGRRFLWIDATGTERRSAEFESTAIGIDGTGIVAAGLRESGPGTFDAAIIDPANGKVTGSIGRWTAKYRRLCGEGDRRTHIARIDARTRLIIGSEAIGIDDGISLAIVDNPAGSPDVDLALENSVVHAVLPSGERRPLFARQPQGWTTDVRSVAAPSPVGEWRRRWMISSYLRIRTVPAAGSVRTAEGTLDTETGWIAEQRPTGLAYRGSSIEAEFRTGRREFLRTAAASRSRIQMQEPVVQLPRGEIGLRFATGTVVLGAPKPGETLTSHRVVRAAPIGTSGASAWIDPKGQLWLWNGKTECVSTGDSLERFFLDESARLHVSGRERAFRVEVVGNDRVSLRAADDGPPLADASRLPDQAGPFRWRAVDGNAGSAIEWSLEVGSGKPIRLVATTSGFDLLSAPRLVLDGGRPAMAFGGDSTTVVAPIEGNSVDWAALRPSRGMAPPLVRRAPAVEYRSRGGHAIRIDPGRTALEFAGVPFEYRSEEARFECNDCRAVGRWEGRILTVLGNGIAFSWSIATNGTLSDPRRWEPPPGGFGDALWNLGPRLVAESAGSSESPRSTWEWDGAAWRPHATARLLRAADARWDWSDDGRWLVDGESYRIDVDRWPLLDCESIDLDVRDGAGTVRAMDDGSIAYRTTSGRWFSITETGNGMPRSREEPPALENRRSIGPLELSRWKAPGTTHPDCLLRIGKLDATIDLRLRDGLVRDLDGWDGRSPFVRVSDTRVLVATAHSRIHRPIEVREGRLYVLDPMIDPPLTPVQRGEPIRSERNVHLGDDHSLRCGDVSLGIPSARGLDRLDPRRFVPISLSGEGLLSFADAEGMYTARVGAVLDSIAEVDAAPGLKNASWELDGREARFMVTAADGRRSRLEQGQHGPRFLEDVAAPPGSPTLVAIGPDAFSVRRPDQSTLVLERSAPEPCEIILHGGEGQRLVLAHLDATGIDDSPRGFQIRSKDWLADYAQMEGGHRLTLVVPSSTAGPRIEPRPVGGGLFARRSGDGTWTLRIGPSADAEEWPLAALLGSRRSYLDEHGGLVETATAWSRRSNLDGTVVARWPDARGAKLAGEDAYRIARTIVGGTARFAVDERGITALPADEPLPARGAMRWSGENGWSVAIEGAGDLLAASCREVPVAAHDGSWTLDFAVTAATGGTTTWLIDRLGRSERNGRDQVWTPHGADEREILVRAAPTLIRAVELQGSLRHLIEVEGSGEPDGLLIPSDPEGPFATRPAGPTFTSWTIGSRLEVMLDTADTVHFRRRVEGSRDPVRFPPVPRGGSVRDGRFAFDSPVELLLAMHPIAGEPRACIGMQTGWEWTAIGPGPSSSTIREEPPEAIEPRFGPSLREEWLESSGLPIDRLLEVAAAVAGRAVIWYPEGDRLYLVGDREAVWIELGPRWRNRALR